MPRRFVYHARDPVESNVVGLEQRLSSLQAQIDGLRQASNDDVRPLEQRLSTLTEYSADILKRWAATADRHASAVGQLEAHLRELGDAGTRLQADASQRLQDLERIVEQEWTALRDIHEAPVRQLVEQAANLTEVCIATANSAQHGFDRAEARLATLEAEFHRTSAELTREMHALVNEVRQLSAANHRQLPAEAPAWPLEGVTRLHQQLRETGNGPRALTAAVADASAPPAVAPVVPPAGPPRAEPNLSLDTSSGPSRTAFLFSAPVAMAIVAALIVIGGIFAWRLQQQVQAAAERAEQSQRESRLAAEAATRDASERQQAAARQLEAARNLAARAQTIGDVLAAPDLIRYALVGTGLLPGASGQALWSRSRGFVFSASGLTPPPPNATYQVWLATRGGAVSAGTFVPDADGRATVTATPSVPRGVFGTVITIEQAGGADMPTGEPVMTRRAPPAPPQP